MGIFFTKTVNMFLRSASVPKDWRMANVTQICRAVGVMSVLRNFVETVITYQVIKHVEGKALLKIESMQVLQTLVLSH